MPNPFGLLSTDRSGTIATGGTSQQLAPVNANRSYLFVQNLSTGDLWINFTAPATQGQGSIRIPANPASFVMESSYIIQEPVTIVGATTGQAFTCKEA